MRLEKMREFFEFNEYEKAKAVEENRCQFISTTLDQNRQKNKKKRTNKNEFSRS